MMIEKTKIEKIEAASENLVELESGEWVTRKLYDLRIRLSLHQGLRFFGLT